MIKFFVFFHQSKQIVIKALDLTRKFRDCLVVEDEKLLSITSSYVSMVIYRPNEDDNITITEVGNINFTLPKFGPLFSELGINKADVTTKVLLFKSNPYAWHPSESLGNESKT